MVHKVVVQKVFVCEDTLMTNRARVCRADVFLEELLLRTCKFTHSAGERMFRCRVVIQ